MRRVLLTILTCIAAMLVVSCRQDATPEPLDWNDTDLNWLSYEDGLAKLKQDGGNGMLIIYADWCPTCKKYSKLFANPGVIEALDGITLIRANGDLQSEVSQRFNIDGEYVPRTFAIDQTGHVIDGLNSNNPNWWYFLPPDNPDYLIKFADMIKNPVATDIDL